MEKDNDNTPSNGIYVEILIRAPIDIIWNHTLTPELHERWDLRFSRIEYLPKAREQDPQRFRYATRIGFGVEVAGEGESVGERDLADGSRSSALKFSSDDPRAIIREGSGYWKYIPAEAGVRFLTWYDYRTRFGRLGAWFDHLIFRPMLGWATAWSFDRLRLWLERGIHPAAAARQALIHGITRFGMVFAFLYQGLVPKVLTKSHDEISMLRDFGLCNENCAAGLKAIGFAEIFFALILLIAWHKRWPSWICNVGMIAALIVVAIESPRFLSAAFNPVSLNLTIACLASIDLLALHELPSAARCLRRPPR